MEIYNDYKERQMSLPQYKKAKIKMLQRDFLCELTKEDIECINNCANEIQVDRYARKCINRLYH